MDLEELQKVETRNVSVFVVDKHSTKICRSSTDSVVKAFTPQIRKEKAGTGAVKSAVGSLLAFLNRGKRYTAGPQSPEAPKEKGTNILTLFTSLKRDVLIKEYLLLSEKAPASSAPTSSTSRKNIGYSTKISHAHSIQTTEEKKNI